MSKGLYPIQVKEGMRVIEQVLAGDEDQVVFYKASDEVLQEMGFETDKTIIQYDESIPSMVNSIRVNKRPGSENYKVEEGFQEIERYGVRLLLDYFQKKNMFLKPGDLVTFHEICASINIGDKFEKVLRAFLGILKRSGCISYENGSYLATSKVLYNGIEDVIKETYPELAAYSKLMKVCNTSFDDILSERVKYTEVMFPGGSKELVTGIYKGNTEVDYYNGIVSLWIEQYIASRISENPNCMIYLIEIGAGTGGTSLGVLKAIDKYRNNIHLVLVYKCGHKKSNNL
jgi:hypothetical protein